MLGGAHRGEAATHRLVASFGITTHDAAAAWIERALVRAEASPHPSWDLGRAVTWTGNVYVAGFFEADHAWSFVLRAAALASARYTGWDMYGADYVAGRQAFFDRRGMGKDDEEAALAWLLRAKKSPWILGPWETPYEDAPPRVHTGATLRVGPGAFATITSALAAAKDGDTISIAPGTYCESLRPEIDVALVAETPATKRARGVAKGARGAVAKAAKPGKPAKKAAGRPDEVRVVADDHALFVDGVAVRATGLVWQGTREDRSAVSVRAGGVLRLRGGAVESVSHGVSVLDRDTLAYLDDLVISRPSKVGVTVWDRAFVRADHVRIDEAKIGVSVEKRASAELVDVAIVAPSEVGVLVEGKAKADVTAVTVTRAGLCGLQVSEGGTLVLRGGTLRSCTTGLLVHRGQATMVETRVAGSRQNGIELHKGANVSGEALVVERSKGSAVFVMAGGELSLSRSTLQKSGFDGVTCAGILQVDDVTVRAPARAAFWLDGPGLGIVRRSVAEGGRVGVRAGEGSCLCVESTTFTGPALGVAVDGGRVAIEASWIVGAREHALQVDGGDLVAGYLTIEGPSEHPLFVRRGRARILSSHLESSGEVHVNGEDASAELRRTTVIVEGDAACAVHAGYLSVAHCRVLAKGANGVEGLAGQISIVASSIEGKACALVLDEQGQATISGGELRATSDVTIELLGSGRAVVSGASLFPGEHGVSRVAKSASLEGANPPKKKSLPTSFTPDLDGDGLLPFELALHAGPSYSLFTTDFHAAVEPHAEAFALHDVALDGYGVSAWVAALVAASPNVPKDALAFEPEAGLFAVASSDRDALVALARCVRETSVEAAREALEAVRAAGTP